MTIAVSLLATQSDARLAQLAARGHDRAFEVIVERYRGPLGRYLRRMLAPTLAEDVLQASFVRAWQALTAGAEVRDPRAWLYRIAHNQAVNALRAAGERTLPEAAPALGPDDEVQRRDELRATLDGIGALPERQRAALLAVAVADRPHADVARELGLSDGGLRQLLLRARTALRAAATALTPPPIAAWLATGQGSTAARVSELAAGAGGLGVAAKVGTAVIATGALAGGTAAVQHERGRTPVTAASAAQAAVAPASSASSAGPRGAATSGGSRADVSGTADDARRSVPDVPGHRPHRRGRSTSALRTTASRSAPAGLGAQSESSTSAPQDSAAARAVPPASAPSHSYDDAAKGLSKHAAARGDEAASGSSGSPKGSSGTPAGSSKPKGPAKTGPSNASVAPKKAATGSGGAGSTPSAVPSHGPSSPKKASDDINSSPARDADESPVSQP